MTSRTGQLGDALLAVVVMLGEHRLRAEEAGETAAAQVEDAGWHGWDGVAAGYETIREHLEGAVAGLGNAEGELRSAVGLLSRVREQVSASGVSGELTIVVGQLTTAEEILGEVSGYLDEAAGAAEAVGAERLSGVIQNLASDLRSTGAAITSIRFGIETEGRRAESYGSAAPARRNPGAVETSDSAVSDRIQELRRQGHAPQRHGPQITEQQLTDRALRGIDPITGTTTDGESGGLHKYNRDASRFTSDAALVKAEKQARTSQIYESQRQANETTGVTFIIVEIPLAEIFGPGYASHVRGVHRNGSKNKPTGEPPGTLPPSASDFTDGTVFAFFRRDTEGHYRLRTMYPKPKE